MTDVKIRKIGNSLGVILPKEILDALDGEEGTTLHISMTAGGVRLDVYDPEVAEQVAAGRDIAKRYRNTLKELSK